MPTTRKATRPKRRLGRFVDQVGSPVSEAMLLSLSRPGSDIAERSLAELEAWVRRARELHDQAADQARRG